jgi:hypothetical protein
MGVTKTNPHKITSHDSGAELILIGHFIVLIIIASSKIDGITRPIYT